MDGGATLWKELSELLPLASAVDEASEVTELQRLFSSGPSSARANALSARGVQAAAKQTVSERPNKIGMPTPMPSSPAQEKAYLDDGDDTNLDTNVAVAAQAAQVAEAEAEAKSAGEQLAGMMRVRGGMGAGASALSVESPDAGMKAAYEGESAQQLKQRLSIAETERDREKHKLQWTVHAAQLKQKEWETEKRVLKRQLENLEAEVRKRDKWLVKAKDIIKEYQKRHAPGQGPAMS